jgi:hypothetical protein
MTSIFTRRLPIKNGLQTRLFKISQVANFSRELPHKNVLNTGIIEFFKFTRLGEQDGMLWITKFAKAAKGAGHFNMNGIPQRLEEIALIDARDFFPTSFLIIQSFSSHLTLLTNAVDLGKRVQG